MENTSIGFIGGGRITRIILNAFNNQSVSFNSVLVYDPDEKSTGKLKNLYPDIQIAGSAPEAAAQDVIFLAVHPPVMMETLQAISAAVNENAILISLAPKISMDKMHDVVPSGKKVRMIPNATSYINKGFNPVSFQGSFPLNEKEQMLLLFNNLGETFEVEEDKLEGYAIISAMLPTYFWFQWKKMEEIGEKTGLSRQQSRQAVQETLLRSISLLYESDLSYEEVLDLIPVKPIGENEREIENIYETRLMGLFHKIRSA